MQNVCVFRCHLKSTACSIGSARLLLNATSNIAANNYGDRRTNASKACLDFTLIHVFNKHLMKGPKGNSELCFHETFNVPRGEAKGNKKVKGKENSLFPAGPVIRCFVIPPNSKIEKTVKKSFA